MYSEESEDDVSEYHLYRRKYYLLLERCEAIQLENERIVSRVQHVHKLILKYRKQRGIIVKHLDQHGDNWREASFILDLRTRNPPNESNDKPKVLKKKSEKPSRDPNAPKRPANPFFQFCQEQRTLLIDTQTKMGPQSSDLTKQEITKELARKWNNLSFDERKIYYEKYEQSKIKYKADCEEYKAKSLGGAASPTIPSTSGAVSTSNSPIVSSHVTEQVDK